MSFITLPETTELLAQVEFGEVEQLITPHQRRRVKFMATSWFARFYHSQEHREALPGTTVKVVGRRGVTLMVALVEDNVMQPQMPFGDRSQTRRSGLLQWVGQIAAVFTNLLS